MPLSVSFSVSQPLGEPEIVTIEDESTGSDVAVTQRRVYLKKPDGTYLVPVGTATEYIQWAIADDTIDIDALIKDWALSIIVQWLNVSNVVLYDSQQFVGLTEFNEDFDYQTCQELSGQTLLINDNSFFQNKSAFRNYIDSGNQAISYASDIFSAQLCYDEATKMRLKSQYLFNINT